MPKRHIEDFISPCKGAIAPVVNPGILHLNLHREWFAAIVAKTKRMEYRRRTPYWKTRLENRQYDIIQFRNGYAKSAPEIQVEFLGVRRIKKDGKNVYAIRLGKILKIKRRKSSK